LPASAFEGSYFFLQELKQEALPASLGRRRRLLEQQLTARQGRAARRLTAEEDGFLRASGGDLEALLAAGPGLIHTLYRRGDRFSAALTLHLGAETNGTTPFATVLVAQFLAQYAKWSRRVYGAEVALPKKDPALLDWLNQWHPDPEVE
jgi:hypothetical protein